MMKKTRLLSTLILSSILLSGCISTASTVSTAITVANERRTTGEVIDDKTIGLRLLAWSTEDEKLSDAHLNFMSFDRKVLVTGEAPNNSIRNYIVKQIKIVDPKVKQVYNEIIISPKTSYLSRLKDAAITTQIEALFLDQEVFHPTHIKVMTENQVVYLMGKVTKREAEKATKIATSTKGINVKKVVKLFDYLKTRPAAEIERDRQRELKAQQEIERKKKQAEIDAKKAELKRQIKELDGTVGTPF